MLIRKTEQCKPGRITVLKTRNSNWNTDGIQLKITEYFSLVYANEQFFFDLNLSSLKYKSETIG
jgi:hypothetical protein